MGSDPASVALGIRLLVRAGVADRRVGLGVVDRRIDVRGPGRLRRDFGLARVRRLRRFGWDDVGTWASLRRARELDDDGNGAHGEVHFVECTGNVVHAEGVPVVLYGVSSMLVVTLPGLTFVTTLDRATELRPLLDALPDEIRNVSRG